MELTVISKIVELYGNTLRRGREPYVAHCLRVAERIHAAGFNDRAVLLALLHDSLELGLVGVSIDVLSTYFKLTQSEVDVLNTLTAKEDESSQEHYERVIFSENVVAYAIKFYDNQDNAVFALEDYPFTRTVLNKDPDEEIKKYTSRARHFQILLQLKGYEV